MAAKKKTGASKAKKTTKSKKGASGAKKKTGAKKSAAKKKTGARKTGAKKKSTGAKKSAAKAKKKTGAKKSTAKKVGAKKAGAKKSAGKKKSTGGKVKKAIYLEFVGGASSKFWEGSVQGNEFHVRYGRIGSDGALQVKTFATSEDAHAQYVKVMEQKLKKGYGVAKKPKAAPKAAKKAAPKKAKKAGAKKNGGGKKKAAPPPATDKPSAYLEFVGGSSSKFWEGSVTGSDLHVRYGRIGSDGATQLKSFGSPDEAREAYDKLVHQKLKKGYSLVH